MKFPEDVLARAAAQAGETVEEYVASSATISLGRKVCAHFLRASGGTAFFVIS